MIEVQNLGTNTILNSKLMLVYNELLFKSVSKKNPVIPAMLPSVLYKFDLLVKNISMNGSAGVIKALVFNSDSSVPMITANLNMPISEIELDN
jgi:Bardet-Biedl syndrome 1 protein